MLVVKWLFYVRDCRKGVGERRLFRICFDYLSKNYIDIAKAVLGLIPEYGRWDDLLELLNGNLQNNVVDIFKCQIEKYQKNMEENKPISLCAKWIPSINASSKTTRKFAHIF